MKRAFMWGFEWSNGFWDLNCHTVLGPSFDPNPHNGAVLDWYFSMKMHLLKNNLSYNARVDITDWPFRSPDFNLIKHIWEDVWDSRWINPRPCQDSGRHMLTNGDDFLLEWSDWFCPWRKLVLTLQPPSGSNSFFFCSNSVISMKLAGCVSRSGMHYLYPKIDDTISLITIIIRI